MLELMFALFWALVKAAVSYFIHGPKMPSWSLGYSLSVAFTHCFLELKRRHTVKRLRILENVADSVLGRPPHATFDDVEMVSITWTIDTKALLEHEKGTRERFPEGVQGGYFVPEEIEYDGASEKAVSPRQDALQYHFTGEFCSSIDRKDPLKKRKCVIVVHGGAFALCTAPMYRDLAFRMVRQMDVDVLSIDYRKPPERPFPAAIHDVFATFLYLIDPTNRAFHAVDVGGDRDLPVYSPEDVLIFGDSAGANIALASLVYMKSFLLNKDRMPIFPLPGGLILHSGWFDLTYSNVAWETNSWVDTIPKTIANSMMDRMYDGTINCCWAYVNGYDPTPRQTRLGAVPTAAKEGRFTLSRSFGSRGAGPVTQERGAPVSRASSFSATQSSPSTSDPNRLTTELALLSLILHPLISAVRTADFSGMPPILIQSASHECMVDDSVMLSERYSADCCLKGKQWVQHEVYAEAVHDFLMVEGFEQSKRAMRRMASWVGELDHLRKAKPLPGGPSRVLIEPDGNEVDGYNMKHVDRLHEFVARLCLVNKQARD